jgi:hypothetical protein
VPPRLRTQPLPLPPPPLPLAARLAPLPPHLPTHSPTHPPTYPRRPQSSRVVTPQLVTRLKVAALEVLVSLAEWPEFSGATDKVVETLRKDIIKVGARH